jgi:hypothetical protein
MPKSYELIASSIVGSGGASNIDFTSIPSTYTDLCLKYSIRGVAAFTYSYAVYTLNNDTTTSTTAVWLVGDGSSAGGGGGSGASTYNRIMGAIPNGNATASTFGNGEFYIPNYANTSQKKSGSGDGVGETNSTAGFLIMASTLWPVTSAINRITLQSYDAGGIPQHSSAYLYGIKNS